MNIEQIVKTNLQNEIYEVIMKHTGVFFMAQGFEAGLEASTKFKEELLECIGQQMPNILQDAGL